MLFLDWVLDPSLLEGVSCPVGIRVGIFLEELRAVSALESFDPRILNDQSFRSWNWEVGERRDVEFFR